MEREREKERGSQVTGTLWTDPVPNSVFLLRPCLRPLSFLGHLHPGEVELCLLLFYTRYNRLTACVWRELNILYIFECIENVGAKSKQIERTTGESSRVSAELTCQRELLMVHRFILNRDIDCCGSQRAVFLLTCCLVFTPLIHTSAS